MSASEKAAVPRRQYPTVMLRMHPDVKAELKRRATEAHRSVNQEVGRIVCAALGMNVDQFPVYEREQQVKASGEASHGH